MVLTGLLFLGVLGLAWSNGANDNFKGVATLYGSGTADYRRALLWATGATTAGGLVSVFLAHGLVATFSGQGLVSDGLIDRAVLTAVGLSGAGTILLATWLGMPTSTTHALTGALVGAVVVVALGAPEGRGGAGGVEWGVLLNKFAQPMLISPVLAVGVTAGVYVVLGWLRLRWGVERQTCVCVGRGEARPVAFTTAGVMMVGGAGRGSGVGGVDGVGSGAKSGGRLEVMVGENEQCVERYRGRVVGVEAQTAVDAVHYLSGAAVCFARAVNDTPKIAALLLAGGAFGATSGGSVLVAVTAAVVVGGLLGARKVARTMSLHITQLNPGQGLAANLVTAGLVLGASRMGVPVSTTHVSCGSIFGIGLVNGRREWGTIGRIFAAWVTTLPVGFALGAGLTWVLRWAA